MKGMIFRDALCDWLDAEVLSECIASKDDAGEAAVRKVLRRILDLPVMDAEPVVHAKWKLNGTCSRCENPAVAVSRPDGITITIQTPRCPSCGAIMFEEE